MLGLFIILLLVLCLPFTMKIVERNLEVFLFICGIMAGLMTGAFNQLTLKALLISPLNITLAVFFAGCLFKLFQRNITTTIKTCSRKIPLRLFLALLVILLGILSSIITAIIAAIVLVTIVKAIHLDRQSEIKFVVIACFSIGMGAVLTPLGEPLSTIATHKLDEDFFFLFSLLGPTILPSLVFFGAIALVLIRPTNRISTSSHIAVKESLSDIFIRSCKIYVFVMALTLLGISFEPFIERYLLHLHPFFLYWLNIISAVLDNATLAAAEISPRMELPTIRAILLGLLISGGMLIPGNIPNIIAANQLKITSKEWARFGLPFGLLLMGFYFIIILLIG